MPGDPDRITVRYHGVAPAAPDPQTVNSFLVSKFQDVAGILASHGAILNLQSVSGKSPQAHGTVPPQNFHALAADLQSHDFGVTRKLMM
jgi:hypothetical protein